MVISSVVWVYWCLSAVYTHTNTQRNTRIHRVQQVEVKRRRVLLSSNRANYRYFVRTCLALYLILTTDNFFYLVLLKARVWNMHCVYFRWQMYVFASTHWHMTLSIFFMRSSLFDDDSWIQFKKYLNLLSTNDYDWWIFCTST